MFVLLILIGVLTALFAWMKWNYGYWERKKVPGPVPSLFVGNIGPTLNFSEHALTIFERLYRQFPNVPYIGYYKMMTPGLILRDPDIIKDVLIKDHYSFHKNDFKMSEKIDPVLAANPFFCVDDEWRHSRKTIAPAFSPNRVKLVYPLIETCARQLVDFTKHFKSSDDVEARALCYRFTVQNVLMCGYSIDARCFDHNKPSEFVIAGRKMFEGSFWAGLKFLAFPFLPKWLLDFIPIPFLPKEMDDLFRKLVMDSKASREKNDDSNDILQMLIQTQKKHSTLCKQMNGAYFSDLFLTGHTVSFFTDGTETSGLTLMFAVYEMAKNPECQERLYSEIIEKLQKHDGEMTYEAFQEIEYLEWTFMEAMRLHPGLYGMSKICTRKYTFPKFSEDAEPLTIYPGTPVQISVGALHMDPKHYPEPEKFIPERFTVEEQNERHKGVYLPFGEGPRICVGMRFALVQVKVALMHLVKNYKIKISPNCKPIVIDPHCFLTTPIDDVLLNFEARVE